MEAAFKSELTVLQFHNALSLDEENESRSLDVLISRIRTKLGESSKEPKIIHSIRGIGYRLHA